MVGRYWDNFPHIASCTWILKKIRKPQWPQQLSENP
jgi:hypothetical protein